MPLRFLTAGESHGPSLVGIVEGMPAGVPVSAEAIDRQLARRWKGAGRGGRRKVENDRVRIVSGVRFGLTTGAPIGLEISNAAHEADRAGWEKALAIESAGDEPGMPPAGVDPVTVPRPGHADLSGAVKYGFDEPPRGPDVRPVIERASARETAMRVACCSVARGLTEALGIDVGSHLLRLGEVGYEPGAWEKRRDKLIAAGPGRLNAAADDSPVRIIDATLSAAAEGHVEATRSVGDTLGGAYEVIATGVPAGLGSYAHWDRRLDGLLAQAILSIPGQKAVEIGDGVAAAALPGSQVHDEITSATTRSSNRAGGVEGGVSNGMPIVVRGYMKPIPTLVRPIGSIDLATGKATPARYERSDITSVPAASVVAEAMVAWVLAGCVLERYGADSFERLREGIVNGE
jgi:chorismate synthase